MSQFNATEIKSKTLDKFMSSEPAPEKEENVVQLPKVEQPGPQESEPNDDEIDEYEPQEPDTDPSPFSDECECVPMIGKIKRASANQPIQQKSLLSGNMIFFGGLMVAGLAAQMLK